MEHILPPSVLVGIYSYLSYDDLRHYKYVPDFLWHQLYDYFCQDYEFHSKINKFWGAAATSSNILSYRYRVLYFIEYLIRYQFHIPTFLMENRNFISDCVDRSTYDDIIIRSKYVSDPDLMLKSIKRNSRLLEYLDSTLKHNREFMLKVVKENVVAMIYLIPAHRQDAEIIYTAVNQLGIAPCNNDDLYRQCLLKIIEKNPSHFYNLDTQFRDDDEFQLASIKLMKDQTERNAEREKYIELYKKQSSQENALIAMKHGMNFHNLSITLLNDDNFIKSALEISPCYKKSIAKRLNYTWRDVPLDIFGNKLRNDKNFLMELLSNDEYGYPLHFGSTLDMDPDINLLLLRRNKYILIHPSLHKNIDFMRKVMQYDPCLFADLDEKLKNDADYVRSIFSRSC